MVWGETTDGPPWATSAIGGHPGDPSTAPQGPRPWAGLGLGVVIGLVTGVVLSLGTGLAIGTVSYLTSGSAEEATGLGYLSTLVLVIFAVVIGPVFGGLLGLLLEGIGKQRFAPGVGAVLAACSYLWVPIFSLAYREPIWSVALFAATVLFAAVGYLAGLLFLKAMVPDATA